MATRPAEPPIPSLWPDSHRRFSGQPVRAEKRECLSSVPACARFIVPAPDRSPPRHRASAGKVRGADAARTNAVLVIAAEEEKETDTWITPKPRRRRRKPAKTRPNQEQVAAERDQALAAAIRCCKNPFNTLRSEHAQTSGSDSGSEISETGFNKAPHIMPGSVDDII
ncbi:hypothetical protein NDU88_004920 [Pleurodeles waltl]|uniref:Uncharacterized protein n=1 Tax=Pleurodeles waltl TaxID=8319 RepID=A0AAV7QDV6_PLEWA|nr:hypothetical protein NDU88_004920 [Pleurodeles waltl]